MTARVFLDGSSGTTGLELERYLAGRSDLSLLRLGSDERRDPAARRAALEESDAAILCLPDEAARKTARLAEGLAVRLLDASTAHRCDPGWAYGFPELTGEARAAIAGAQRVANPGCYATGALALLRPLAEAGLLAAAWRPVFHAVSGYSGGGRGLIQDFEQADGEHAGTNAYLYGLGLEHKHLPEIAAHGGHPAPPLLLPSVGRFARGMAVSLPLPEAAWKGGAAPSLGALEAVFRGPYEGEPFISVEAQEGARTARLNPEACNGSNRLAISLFTEAGGAGGARLAVACLDNLGKGAAGAAVQNLNLMLGAEEASGLL